MSSEETSVWSEDTQEEWDLRKERVRSMRESGVEFGLKDVQKGLKD